MHGLRSLGTASSCRAPGAALFAQPLSFFVARTMVMSGVQLYLSYVAVTSWKSCAFPDSAFLGFKTFVLLQVVFTLLNLAFVFYLRRQVWKMILALLSNNEHKPVEPGSQDEKKQAEQDVEASPEATKILVTKATVRLAFRKVLLQDVLMLPFCLALTSIFVISIMAMPWLSKGDSCPAPSAAIMGLLFFLVSFAFTLVYYCCGCCTVSIEVEKSMLKERPLETTRPVELSEPTATLHGEAPQGEGTVAESQLSV